VILLQVHELNKQFGVKTAVDGLTFHLEQGRCTALLGPNGAGKTTTLRMLAGLLAPTSGRITFKGREGVDVQESIGYLPQYPAFYNWMSGKEYLEFSGKLARLTSREAAIRGIALLERVEG
jgi:ABC-2 type transport system ATP-binding protein